MSRAALLLTGLTRAGKSFQLADAADYLWEHHKKILRIYAVDGGGWPDPVQDRIDVGIIEVWRPKTRFAGRHQDYAEETLALCSNGYWPKLITDPRSGEGPPEVEMLAPVSTSFKMSCRRGHLLREVKTQNELQPLLCRECQVQVTLREAVIHQAVSVTPGFERVGGVAQESLTSFCDVIMDAVGDRRGKGELGGEKPGFGGAVKSGEMTFGANNRADFQYVQNQAWKWLHNASGIPNLVIPPIFTALEDRFDDEQGLPFWSPQIPGKASAAKVPSWGGIWLGLQKVKNRDSGSLERRLYIKEFRGEDGAPHVYSTRGLPDAMPTYLKVGELPPEDAPEVYFPGAGLKRFFELLDENKGTRVEELRAKFPDAPGLRAADSPPAITLEEEDEEQPPVAVAAVARPMAQAVAVAKPRQQQIVAVAQPAAGQRGVVLPPPRPPMRAPTVAAAEADGVVK